MTFTLFVPVAVLIAAGMVATYLAGLLTAPTIRATVAATNSSLAKWRKARAKAKAAPKPRKAASAPATI